MLAPLLLLLAQAVAPTPDPIALSRAALSKARCGDAVELAPGDYGQVRAPRVTCPADGPRVWVDASRARMTQLLMYGAHGLDWHGGHVEGIRDRAGVSIDGSTRVAVTGMTVTRALVGFSILRASDVSVRGSRVQGHRSDGFNVNRAQRVALEYNAVIDPDPVRATYDARGKLVKDGDHPDCVQMWSTAGTPPVADVSIRGMYCRGYMQGIAAFNAGAGGLDRIAVEDNLLDGIGFWHGITLTEARDSRVVGNTVRTTPGALAPNDTTKRIRAWIMIARGERTLSCGNVVEAIPAGEGTGACP